MKYVRLFKNYYEYNKEEGYLEFPSVSYITDDNILRYKNIPTSIRESLVCWYSPRRQRLTNEDVVESYSEDFTTWRNFENRGTAIVTKDKVTITGSLNIQNIVEDATEPYGDVSIYVTGISEEVPLAVRDLTGTRSIITKEGIYEFSNNSRYFGFGINKALSDINVVITQLPTSKLYDFSENGHSLYLHGFDGKLNSGVGIYKVDYTTSDNYVNSYSVKLTNSKTISGISYNKLTRDIESYTVNITGLKGAEYLNFFYRNEEGKEVRYNIKYNGIYTVPKCYKEGTTGASTGFTVYNMDDSTEVTIEQVPQYQYQLCHNGKEYGISYELPLMTDYTVLMRRTRLDNTPGAIASKRNVLNPAKYTETGAFSLEKINSVEPTYISYSYGASSEIQFVDDPVTWQTRTSYNGNTINGGFTEDTDKLLIGAGIILNDKVTEFSKVAWNDFLLFNRALTHEEIEYVKYNLMDNIPDPVYDYDFSEIPENVESCSDKYGNILELHNFAWKGMSGLNGYPIDLKGTFPRDYTAGTNYVVNHKRITCNEFQACGLFQVKMINSLSDYIEIPSFKVRMTGLLDKDYIVYEYIDSNLKQNSINVKNNEITELPKSYIPKELPSQRLWLGFVLNYHNDNKNVPIDFKLEVVPDHPGALVFDGVDDYAKLVKGLTIKTVILDVEPLQFTNRILYDNRTNKNNFAIFNSNGSVAYTARNEGNNVGTYINGEKNDSTLCESLIGKRHIAAVYNDEAGSNIQVIGAPMSLTELYSKMALYRITGFSEVLSPEKIKCWYEKNRRI